MQKPPAGRSETSNNPPPPSGGAVSAGNILRFVSLLLLLVVPIGVYFIFHKPLPPEALGRLRGMVADLLGAGWILWVAFGIGRPFLRKTGLSGFERAALSGALGLGVLGILFLAAAWAGFFTNLLLTFLLAGLTVPVSLPLLRDVAGWIRNRPAPPRGGAFSILLAAFAAAALLLSLGIALAPPAAWDALVYHLRIPQQIVAAHSLDLPDTLFLEMPHGGEMLYAAAMGIGGRAETAAALGWGIGLLALIGMTGMAARWGLRHALLPAALLLAGDTLAQSLGWGYVDWVTALFGFAALAALTQRDSGARWSLLAGIFAGLAMGTKYTAGVALAAALLAVIAPRDWTRSAKEAGLILGGFLVGFSPWIVRGWIAYGNPLPPLLDAGETAALKLAFFNGRPLPGAWLISLAEPWLQGTIGSYGSLPFGVTVGPLLIALVPAALLRRPEETPAGKFLFRALWIGALLYWIVSGVGGLFSVSLIQPRLYLALFPGIALLAACGFERLWEVRLAKIRLGALAAVLILVVLAAELAGLVRGRIDAGQPEYLAGIRSEQEYLEGNLGWYARAMAAVRALPGGPRVLLLWEPRGFWCGAACSEDATIDRWYLAMREYGSAEAAAAAWRAEGWTHILIFETGAGFERGARPEYAPADWTEYDALRAMLPVVERFGDGYVLYALR
jgi:hypothetical protein